MQPFSPRRNVPRLLRWTAALLLCTVVSAQAERPRFDGLLVGGLVVDGSGAAPRRADIGWRDGRITAMGDLAGEQAAMVRDVTGLVVAPGFIDVHSHSDEDLVTAEYRGAPAMLRQGVTLAVFGVDGELDSDPLRDLIARIGSDVAVNWMAYVGHNGVRRHVMGDAARPASVAEISSMQQRVRDGMEAGAVGLSTGLMYLPGRDATTDEVVELARVAASYGGVYDSHDRDPAFDLMNSINEVLEVGRRAGLEAHVAHLKAVGRKNFGRTPEIIALIDSARRTGPVSADVYPYDGATARLAIEVLVPPPGTTAAELSARLEQPGLSTAERSTAIAALAREWQQLLRDPVLRAAARKATESPPVSVYSWPATVGYDSFRIVSTNRPALQDRMIVDLASDQAITPFDVLAGLIEAEGSSVKLTMGAIQEAEVRELLRQPWVMISSDGREGGLAGGGGHPRYRGSFARILGHYVRDEQVLTLADAVHKMTGRPAEFLRLADRGRLEVGAWADVAVFDPTAIGARSTWDHPELYAVGMRHVFLSGEAALLDGELTGTRAGRFIPYSRPRPEDAR